MPNPTKILLELSFSFSVFIRFIKLLGFSNQFFFLYAIFFFFSVNGDALVLTAELLRVFTSGNIFFSNKLFKSKCLYFRGKRDFFY